MALNITVAGHGAKVQIEVFDYENRRAVDLSDANWLNCAVSVTIDKFSAQFNASFTTADFFDFYNKLSNVLEDVSGTASFLTDEENLKFEVTIAKTGKAVVKGVAQIYGQRRASLSFSFESDQSFFTETLSNLKEIITKYPIKK